MNGPRRTHGFTLLEVLIALVVLGLGVIGILSIVPTGVRSAAAAADSMAADELAASVVAALRLAAAERTHVAWEEVDGARQVQRAFLLLPLPEAYLDEAGVPRGLPTPDDPAVFGSRACLLLPFGSERVFVYPRRGEPEQVARENGQGDPARARDDGQRINGEPLVRRVYGGRSYTGPDGKLKRGLGYALSIQRAEVGGRPRDGLYSVTIYVYRGFEPWEPGSPAEEAEPLAIYTTELMAGPGGAP